MIKYSMALNRQSVLARVRTHAGQAHAGLGHAGQDHALQGHALQDHAALANGVTPPERPGEVGVVAAANCVSSTPLPSVQLSQSGMS